MLINSVEKPKVWEIYSKDLFVNLLKFEKIQAILTFRDVFLACGAIELRDEYFNPESIW